MHSAINDNDKRDLESSIDGLRNAQPIIAVQVGDATQSIDAPTSREGRNAQTGVKISKRTRIFL